MTTETKRDPLEYVINRMEKAAHSNAPAANGYGQHRRDLLDGIAELRAQVARLETENLRLRNTTVKFKILV